MSTKFRIIFKDNLGHLIVKSYTEGTFHYVAKICLEKKLIIYDRELSDIEVVQIPKNIVDRIVPEGE